MEDRPTTVRNRILDRLETGELSAGDKLPGARDIAAELGYPLITVQHAIDELVKKGVLMTVPRRGTFVHEDWRSRILQRNITLFHASLPWADHFQSEIKQILPHCRVCQGFNSSVFEIRTTQYVQTHHDEYLNLAEIFNECVPDQSDIITTPFKSFYVGERLVGLPIIYSPRVLFYNPRLLAAAGCDEPYSGWSWEEFQDCVLKLKKTLPCDSIFKWHADAYLWLNFVMRAGGSLINPERNDPVTIDSPETRYGLKLFRELRDSLDLPPEGSQYGFRKRFLAGKAAMTVDARAFLASIVGAGFKDWKTVTLPRIPGGKDVNVQATELFCVRKSCVDLNDARELVKLLYSESFQNYLADIGYGIPIRKSAAARAIDYEDPADMLFLAESAKMIATYNLESVDLFELVNQSIKNLLTGDEDIDEATAELATMVRSYMKLKAQLNDLSPKTVLLNSRRHVKNERADEFHSHDSGVRRLEMQT
jgi:ABC-type glycerol-3-phosphate transport system substrate-binding protein